MDIDMSALRGLVREKEISFDLLVEAIESALLIAYHREPGSRRDARVELDRTTGHVTVLAKEDADELEEGAAPKEFDDTPGGFGRIAAMKRHGPACHHFRLFCRSATHHRHGRQRQ